MPIVTVGLWWLLGHTIFGEAVRASATNPDLARLTGISPKMMSTAIWTIGGLLSGIALVLYATQGGSTDLVQVGPETLLLALTAALIGGMTSFPRTVAGAIFVGMLYQVLTYNFPDTPGLVQFVLFILVLVLVARVSRTDAASGDESFSFAPRVPPVPERLREVWWVRRMPTIVAAVALAFAVVLPARGAPVGAPRGVLDHPRHRDRRGLGHRADRLGRPAVARPGRVRRARRVERRRVRPRRHPQHRLAIPVPARGRRRSGPTRWSAALLLVVVAATAIGVDR